MKTYSAKPSHVKAKWHVFDAEGKTLGRLATEIAVLLQGKHKPMYTRHILTGDYVVVVNAGKIKVTGKKPEQKMYRRHSHYPGALRETPLSVVQERHPDRIIRAAVQGMLPKNIRGRQMLRRLKIYAGGTHPHEAQVGKAEGAEAEAVVREQPVESQVVTEPEVQEEQLIQEEAPEAAEESVEEATTDELQTEEVEEAVEETADAEVSAEVEDSVEEQPADDTAEESSEEKAGD